MTTTSREQAAPSLEEAAGLLQAVAPVREIRLGPLPSVAHDAVVGATLIDHGGRGHQFALLQVRGALGLAGVERVARLATAAADGVPVVAYVESVGPRIAAALRANGIGYLDAAGNCHVELDGGRLLLHVEGRRRARKAARRGALRGPGHRALFVLLAEPALAGATVRDIAARAGVSRHAVAQLLDKLRHEGALVRRGRTGHVWAPGSRGTWIDRFAAGWTDHLRQRALVGRYRTREQEPEVAERTVEQALRREGVAFGFGGGAGAARLTRYFRGTETVVHVAEWRRELAASMGAVPDRDGPLQVMGTLTDLDLRSPVAGAAHPLLVYAELAADADPRARDAARMVLEQFLEASER